MVRALCAPTQRPPADRCPGAVVLHAAADGALARVRLPGGRLSAAQLRALARAVALGNGLADLTSRANVQVRGLPSGAGGELARVLSAAGLLPSPAHDRARNVLASPVAARHPRAVAETDAVVAEIDRRLCADAALAALPGRFLFAVDDGSGLALDHAADVALVAGADGAFGLVLAGLWTTARLDADAAAGAAVAAARAFLAERDGHAGRAWRLAELEDGAAAVAGRLGVSLVAGPHARGSVARLAPGRLGQRDGRVALTALVPLGRLDAVGLGGLAEIAGEVRISTGRTVTVPDVSPGRAAAVQAALERLGLVVSDRSGWAGLTACAGMGACARARADVRAAAARRAAVRDPRAGAEHWAACERRCGERPGQPVAVVATSDGLVVRRGAGERPVATVDDALAVLAAEDARGEQTGPKIGSFT
jgi:precorrin-3B synthase